ncbi:maleylpyruvate isomerase family mycothiol-dependent enzyme, partial [Actinomycetospora sp. TBRC 11914]|uniref:maleylpyruvate isomerase family mycothiol-dependent enzyme n=1 Tax=Actinomycetospora sp. TBRC 11914 TaxID=2729387 RepID=UPI00145DAA3A
MDTWELIAGERARLVEALGTLDDAQWATPSLCEGWTTKDTLAHVVSTAEMTPPRFFLGLAGAGFSFSRLMDRNVAAVGADPVPRLLERLAARIGSRNAPPGPTGSWLVETVAHGEDIAYPTATKIPHSEEALVAAADSAKDTQPLLGARKRIAGLRLRADDVDWQTGDGPEVRGPLRLLLLAMVGRPPVLDDLHGDGVAELRSR